ncbi:hypothetical protein pb186bvf_006033 [Paramecium bursaria]
MIIIQLKIKTICQKKFFWRNHVRNYNYQDGLNLQYQHNNKIIDLIQ